MARRWQYSDAQQSNIDTWGDSSPGKDEEHMKNPKKAHKQSKRLTILLIPDSPKKVRSLHPPYWSFTIFLLPLIVGGAMWVAIVMPLQWNVEGLETRLGASSTQIDQVLYEKSIAEEERDSAQRDLETALKNAQTDNASHQTVINDYDQKLGELLLKMENYDNAMAGIIGVFDYLDAIGIPVPFDESQLFDDMPVSVGGPYTGDRMEMLAELDIQLSNELDNMQLLESYALDLGEYIKTRPTGWPVEDLRIGSVFGLRPNSLKPSGYERHEGIDLLIPMGSPVYATADGTVTYAGWNNGGYGYLVVIQHGNGFSTYYAHNSRVLVSVGDTVERGHHIAVSGSTGRSSAPHCHYEVRIDGVPQDPREYLGAVG
jgi:murein DD-endopeptidase MepM/ murein hydrolase activator NlpD